jgi:peptidoglycan/xylan/chitin deacetylase (PgdA/CDA1 family)
LAAIGFGAMAASDGGSGESGRPPPAVATVTAGHGGAAGRHARAPGASGPHAATLPIGGEGQAADATLRYTGFVGAGTSRAPEVALTFDDGPGPSTEAILRTLLATRTPATFFIVGQQLRYFGGALREEIRHGFEIGDHTENHVWLPRLRAAAQYGQINDAALRIRHLGGGFPRLFRPPYGAVSAGLLRILHGLRMLMVLWSVDPGDWRRPGVRAIVSNVLTRARAGAIVIMHDGGGNRDQTAAALPQIITGLRKRRLRLVTVAQLLRDDPPSRHQPPPHLGGQ